MLLGRVPMTKGGLHPTSRPRVEPTTLHQTGTVGTRPYITEGSVYYIKHMSIQPFRMDVD